MFTYKFYERLLKNIQDKGFKFVTPETFDLSGKSQILLFHDVDFSPVVFD